VDHPNSDEPVTLAVGDDQRHWWRERSLWVLLALVVCIHFSRLSGPPLHGEETRRATVAMEMIRTGDWIVPSLQEEIYFMSNRPPLQQWLIGAIGLARGDVDAVAVRLPSALAVLLTVLLVYGYCRSFMPVAGAFTAAAAVGSMCQVLEMGKLGESDALFTLFVSSSMLLWHLGFMRRWPAWRTWSVAYVCVALATLTKGPQAPAYFAASVGIYLLITRRWRYGISLAHGFGILVFLGIWGSWQLAFFLETEWQAMRHLYFGDVVLYGLDRRLPAVLEHLARYPLEILICTLPWSLLLAGYFRSGFRTALGGARQPAIFACGAILACLPSVWWVVGAQSRFFMSLYPCFAVLAGIIALRAVEATAGSSMARTWRDFVGGISILMVIVGITFLAATLGVGSDSQFAKLAQPLPFGILFAVASTALAITCWRVRQPNTARQHMIGAGCVVAFFGLIFSGAIANIDVRDSPDKTAQISHIKTILPPGTTLYSLGNVEHSFAYFYRDAIERCPWPAVGDAPPDNVQYFCFAINQAPMKPFDFGWEPIAHMASKTDADASFPTLVVVARRAAVESAGRDPHEVVRLYLDRGAEGLGKAKKPGS